MFSHLKLFLLVQYIFHQSIVTINCHPVGNVTASGRVLSKRMIGGKDAAEGEAPFAVRILLNNYLICSGALIGDDVVLTAAHCA